MSKVFWERVKRPLKFCHFWDINGKKHEERKIFGAVLGFLVVVTVLLYSALRARDNWYTPNDVLCECRWANGTVDYYLSVPCPHLVGGDSCDGQCYHELEEDPSYYNRLINPEVGARVCNKEGNATDPEFYYASVNCYLDINPCGKPGFRDVLITIGSSWGWVTLAAVPLIMIWNCVIACIFSKRWEDDELFEERLRAALPALLEQAGYVAASPSSSPWYGDNRPMQAAAYFA